MVHALQEAYRVLKPGGLALDLRPAKSERQIGVRFDGQWHAVGAVNLWVSDDRAADDAVQRVVKQELFEEIRATDFAIRRYLDSPRELRDYFTQWPGVTIDPRLVEGVERFFRVHPNEARIEIQGFLTLRVLRKK